jgi:hypothetical protein
MMNSDDVPRGLPYQQGRKSIPSKYQDNRYSPSANYNYNSNGGFPSQQQYQRRRIDNRFKKDNVNYNDRIMRQNDLIIRLLKEIRDRLPSPPVSAPAEGIEVDIARTSGRLDEAGRIDVPQTEQPESATLESDPDTAVNSVTEPPAATGAEITPD